MKKITYLLSSVFLAAAFFVSNNASAQANCAWAKKGNGTSEDWARSVATDAAGNVYTIGNFYSQNIVFGTTTLHNQPYDYFNYGSEMFLVKYDACGNFKWAKAAGGNSETRAQGVATDANGNVFVTGYFNSDTLSFGTSPIKLLNRSYYDAFVVKYDSTGNVIWAKSGDGNDYDRGSAITTDGSGNVYLTGVFASDYFRIGNDSVANSYSGNSYDVFVAKLDNNGNPLWITSGGGDYDDYGYGIGTDAAGNVYVAGSFGSTYMRFDNDSLALNSYYDIFIAKFNSAGTEQWLRTAGDADNDQAYSLATDAAGNSFITGFIGTNSTVSFGTASITNSNQSLSGYIAKYNSSGTGQWARLIHGNSYTASPGYCVRLDATGNAYVIGHYNSDSLKLNPLTLYNNSIVTYGGGDTVYDIYVAKYKGTTGSVSWARTAGGTSHEFGYGIATGPNNSVYIAGQFFSPSVDFSGITLTTTDTDGDVFIANNIATSTVIPDICMVTVDSLSSHNIVYWDKTQYPTAASFNIYREDVTNVYHLIGSTSVDSLSEYHDYDTLIANPNSNTKRYKLSVVDTAGLEGGKSNYHNTIYIISVGGGQYTWNPLYTIENSPNPVNNYALMRDNNSTGVWFQVNMTAGTQATIVDPAFASFPNARYYVATLWNISCDPSRSIVNTSRSNIKSVPFTGIDEISASANINVAPNPLNNETQITSASRIVSVELFNSVGQLVYGEKVANLNSYTLSASEFAAGVYHLKVKTEKGTAYKKLMIQK